MRILDLDTDKAIERICFYLTPTEAKEMLDDLESLLADSTQHHAHINDKDYKREITLTIYTERNIESFDERSKILIKKGY